jgi:hypothetical protein
LCLTSLYQGCSFIGTRPLKPTNIPTTVESTSGAYIASDEKRGCNLKPFHIIEPKSIELATVAEEYSSEILFFKSDILKFVSGWNISHTM